jgi:hypothetical protein
LPITSFTFKISGVAAYTDGTSGPFETTYSNGVISSPFESESNINFSQLYTDESDVVDSLQELLTLGSPDGKYLNFIVSAPVIDKTISDWWMDISGIVTYDDETSGYYCVQYRNGSFNDLDGKANFYALLADPVASGAITDALQSVSSVSEVAVLNLAPTDITLSSASIAENNEIGAVIGTFSTVDPDAGNSFTCTFVAGTGDTNNASFTIVGSSLKANAAFNFESKNSYTVRVRSTDQGGLTTEKAFTITVTDVAENQAPTDISISAASVAENNAIGAVIGTFSTVDPDAGDSFTYSLASGTGDTNNASFTIDGSSLKADAAFDYQTEDSYSVRIRSTDQGGLYYENVFTITVTAIGGTLWGWGYNQGALGDNTGTSRSSPVQTIARGINWQQASQGLGFTAGIKTDGTLWLWGKNNPDGCLGDNTTISRFSPVQTVSGGYDWKQVSAGGFSTAAIKTDGTLWVWGQNYLYAGNLGDNTVVNKSSPVQTVCAGNNWKQVSNGKYNCAAIKTDGTLWTWGFNSYDHVGVLGDNTGITRSSPVQTIARGNNWKQVSCGTYSMAAIKTDGTLWTWGGNSYGQLGDNTTVGRSSPVQTISRGTDWKQVSIGMHCAAIKTDGTLWLWGRGTDGDLGNNARSNMSSPVQTVTLGTDWKQVACGIGFTGAVKYDGTLWMWGKNGPGTFGAGGRLGDNTLLARSSPVQTIAGGNNWEQVSCTNSITNLSNGASVVCVKNDQ